MNNELIYSKIKLALKEQDKTIVDLCKTIGITQAGFHKMVLNDTMTIKTLNKISEYLNIPIISFFDNNIKFDFKKIRKEKYLNEIFEAMKEVVRERIKK